MRYFIASMVGGHQLLVQSRNGYIELAWVEEITEISQERFKELMQETEPIEL